VHECWAAKKSITDWMAERNITDFEDLSLIYRQKQKKIWRDMSPKKVVYWANEEVDLPMEEEDTIEWWGVSDNVGQILGRNNPVILANKDEVYLDFGFNNMYGVNNGDFAHWRKAYSFQPRMQHVNVIGGESCIWGENTNRHNFDQKVTQRSSVIGERLWNDHVDINTELNNIATRLTAHCNRLRARGLKVWPVTVGLCEQDMENCF
jgi:hexosaminidase